MAKSRRLEELQAQLNQIRDDPTSEAAIDLLQQVFKSKYPVAIAQAARIVRDAELRQLMPHLVATFDRFMQKPETTDPNCLGKKAIADALYRLNYAEETPFLKGIRHVQMEPVWGGRADTAPGLRAICALGLVRINYPDVMTELADLLADPELEARIGAVRAIAYNETAQGVPLLRLRVKVGDEPNVLSECFSALLKLAPTASLPLVSHYLNTPEAQTREMAALALGESHLTEAFPILQNWWQHNPDAEIRQMALLAIAMLRFDTAIEFLLELVATGSRQDSQAAVEALQIYANDRALASQIEERINQRKQKFPDKDIHTI